MIRQTGHPVEDWPLVIVKELVDNAIDEAEEAGIAPEIEIVVDANAITVATGVGASRPPLSTR